MPRRERHQVLPGKGYVVIGGARHPVQDICLRDGRVMVKFTRHGPCDAVYGPITVFGDDGRGIVQGKIWDLRALRAGEHWECWYGLTVRCLESTADSVFRP